MANEERLKTVGTETRVLFGDLRVEEIRQLEIVRIKSEREGEEPSYSYHFNPSVHDVPKDFLVMNGIVWVPCDEAKMSCTMRNLVQHLKEKGDCVEVSSSTGGISCFHLNFRDERIALWFNAWTSTTVVIDGDGKVRKPIFAKEGAD